MRTYAIFAGIAILAATVACGRATDEPAPSFPAEIDLTTITSQTGDGHGASPAAEPTATRQLLLQPNQPIDLFLRVPGEARLVFSLAAGVVPAAIAIDAESPKARASLRSESGEAGERVVSLEQFAGQRIRLRLTNRAYDPIAMVRPRVIGVDTALPPPIDRRPQLADARLNVVLFVVDTLRADRLSAYGYERETSPRIKALAAAHGLLFERAYSAGSSTWPSIKAVFASRFPSEFGEQGLALNGPVAKTLAEVFREGGYATAAFNGNFSMIEESGFARGFESYVLLRRDTPDGPPEVAADVIYDKTVAWLREHRDQPFFLYIQTMDVHGYDAPPPWRGKFSPANAGLTDDALKRLKQATPEQLEALRAVGKLSPERQRNFKRFNPNHYDEAVAYTDDVFGRLVDTLGELGLAERTLIVLTADHGEPLGQRGHMFHGQSLHQELIHVPLVMLIPGRSAAERVKTVVSLMDLGPTLVDLAGLPVPEQFVGRSLLQPRTRLRPPSAFGEQPPFPRGPKVQGRPFLWYAREGRWKLLMDPDRVTLYDLSTDPGELKDVSAEHPIETGYLVDALTQRVALLRGAPPASAEALTPEARQKLDSALRALGYVQ